MDVFANILRFPVPFEFQNAALGLRRQISVGSLRGYLWLPCSNNQQIGEPFAELLPPRSRHTRYAQRVYLHTFPREGPNRTLYWGKYFAHDLRDPINTAVASVSAALITFAPLQNGRVLNVKDVAVECMEQFPIWASHLVDWVEALTRQDLDAAHPLINACSILRWTTTPWTYRSGSNPQYTYVNPSMVLIGSDGKGAIGIKDWRRLIRAANNLKALPEVWALLRDSRAARNRGYCRRAVLDAATAVELVVEAALKTKLERSNPSAFVVQLLKNDWQISRRLHLMKTLGMWLPTDLDKKVVLLRNKVIHENLQISKAQATAAVSAAEELAEHHIPLKCS